MKLSIKKTNIEHGWGIIRIIMKVDEFKYSYVLVVNFSN